MHIIEKTPIVISKKIISNQIKYFPYNINNENDIPINFNFQTGGENSEVEFLDKIIRTISKEKDFNRDYYEKYPYKISQLISIIHFCLYIFYQNKNSPRNSKELNEIFNNFFILLMKKLIIIENILSFKDSQEKARKRMKNSSKRNKLYNIELSDISILNKNSENNYRENNNIEDNYQQSHPHKKQSGLYLSTKNHNSAYNFLNSNHDKSPKLNISPLNLELFKKNEIFDANKMKKMLVNNPLTTKIQKNKSLKSFCDILDITKTKLTNRRVLNRNEININNQGKIYLHSLTAKSDNSNININNQSIYKKNMAKKVSTELKTFTKATSNLEKDSGGKAYFSNFLCDTENNINTNSNSTNITGCFNLERKTNTVSYNSVSINLENNSNNNTNSNNSNKSNNTLEKSFQKSFTSIDEKDLTNNIILTPNIFNKNSAIFKKSLFDKSPSPTCSRKDNIIHENSNYINLLENFSRKQNKLNLKFIFPDDEFNLDNLTENFSNINCNHIDCENIKSDLLNTYKTTEQKLCINLFKDEKINITTDTDNYEINRLKNSSLNIYETLSIDSQNSNCMPDNRKFLREESIVNEILDEGDSQFDDMIELMDDIQISDHCDSEKDHSPVNNCCIKISDFKLIFEISSGGYGRVDLYKKISTGDIFAIKTVDINKMKSKNISGLLKNEALIMNEIYCEHIVKCYYIFSDEKNYYYVMEYMPGGDLHNFLNEYSLSYETIQFIIGELILALKYLHSKNIIHRDIKPENIVISCNGHFKLTDFGISEVGMLNNKYVISNKSSFDHFNDCDFSVDPGKILGTQNYMAPEVINGEKVSYETDYWSVGVLLFELFTNSTPFHANNVEKIFDNISNLKIDWDRFDKEISNSNQREIIKDLIKKFLVIDQNERWGDKNIEEIKSHIFFSNFDWKNVKRMKNLLVLKYVSERMKKTKQIKIIVNNDKDKNLKEEINCNDEGKTIKEDPNIFYSERVDNLYKKNEDVLKTNIKLKKIDIDIDDINFTNLINDLDCN